VAQAVPPNDESQEAQHRVKLDLTVNVPTIVTLVLLVISTVSFGVRLYTDLDQRVSLAGVMQEILQQRVASLESAIGEIRQNQAREIKELRSEIRADLGEIKGTLNNLLYNRPQP